MRGREVGLSGVELSSTADLLQYLHGRLEEHFRSLRDSRAKLEPASPVFALEHDLSDDDMELLEKSVRAAISDHHLARYQATWLPFIVYAAEMGYGYEGDEYWTTFSSQTPRWTSQDRSTIREWFVRFHDPVRRGSSHWRVGQPFHDHRLADYARRAAGVSPAPTRPTCYTSFGRG